MSILLYIIIPLILTGIVLVSLKFLIQYLKKYKILDKPVKRSNHYKPTPKGGGIIIIPIILGMIIFLYNFNFINSVIWIFVSMIMLLLFVTSLIDDIYNLPSIPRLIIQLLCVLITINYLDPTIQEFIKQKKYLIEIGLNTKLIIIIFKAALILHLLWIINLFNFMDGMDGITAVQICSFATGITMIALFGYLPYDYSYLGILIFSTFLGFLYWNKPPSKIFLGDVGSIPIGYLVGFVSIEGLLKYDCFFPIMILILFHFLDSSITLIKRTIKGKPIFRAHSEHFYQKKIRNGFSHRVVLKRITLLNLFLIILSLVYFQIKIFSLVLAVLSVLILLIWLQKEKSHDYQK